jgi:hypothetical protein
MIVLEPKKPRKAQLSYTVAALPDEVLAIVRLSWFSEGKPKEVDEMILLEDGDSGYATFHAVVSTALIKGANVTISSSYRPEDLGIPT